MPISVDRFVEDRRARWGRLAALVEAAQGRVTRLGPAETLEVGHLYRAATSDLAIAQRDFKRDAVAERLNDLVAAAHAIVYSEAPASRGRLWRAAARDIPRSVRANLPFTLAALGVFLVPAIATFAIGLASPEIAASALPAAQREELVRRVPGSEIPIDARPVAGPLIIANNLYVSVLAFGGGLSVGLLTIYALVENGAMMGTLFAVLAARGVAGNLLTFILGHGFLELSAIFLSGGAGLRFAWAILHPGELYRRDAIRLAGLQAIQVMFLVAATLTVAGIIEAFVSPTLLPVGLKLAVGITSGALLWSYILFAGTGRIAAQRKRFFSSR
ncbi:MAG TPA: stage II sporulation protein M [Candidatus Limnocylindria bacterium]|nr:stage II sporulation protein M [Candidatus Limnocylindria bacterium]